MNAEYYNIEIDNNYISVFKGFKIETTTKLNKINFIEKTNDWWKKEYLYDKYIKNKNLDWWKVEFINKQFNTDF
jgi:hypothetical protein